jgi:hypothetical protein
LLALSATGRLVSHILVGGLSGVCFLGGGCYYAVAVDDCELNRSHLGSILNP